MPPKNKMTTKQCPECDTPCAVACKTCSCGYSFYHAKRSDAVMANAAAASSANPAAAEQPEDGVRQRRTQRIKEKPNYYDATEFMKEKRKRRRRNDDQYELRRPSEPPPPPGLKRRKRRKGRGAPKEEEEEEEVLPIGISPEKTVQCAIILADLNRRIQSTAVRVR